MDPIKPGTRCECREHGIMCKGAHDAAEGHVQCTTDAVRMVRDEAAEDAAIAWLNEVTNTLNRHHGVVTRTEEMEATKAVHAARNVPMCEPCATFHEAKAGAR